MTTHDDSFPSTPEIEAPALTRRDRLALLAEGAAPVRPAPDNSLAGAFE